MRGCALPDTGLPKSDLWLTVGWTGKVTPSLILGATSATAGGGEWSGFYARAFGQSVAGAKSIDPNYGGGNASLHLQEDLLGVSCGLKF